MVAILLLLSLLVSVTARECNRIRSCSQEALRSDVNPCCVASPSGLFVFRQRFEPDVGGDMGSWGIDGLEVLDCATKAETTHEPYAPSYTHEEIGSFCHGSNLFADEGILRAEGEWAQSEVGEGVEEQWERAWNTAGRYISTLSPSCADSSSSAGDQVAAFFQTLHELYTRFPISTILADHDIIPSEDVTYVLSELIDALSFDDFKPIVTCDNMTLFSVSWPLYLTGPFQAGAGGFVPATMDRQSNCPKDGIIYIPSISSLATTTTTSCTWDEIYRPTPRALTKEHDESRLVPVPPVDRGQPQKDQLRFFKGSDEKREGRNEGKVDKQYWRDEL